MRESNSPLTLYVGGLGRQADTSTLRTLFADFGGVTDVRVVLDQATTHCRGFGYVSFADPRGAIDAQLALDGRSLGGGRLGGGRLRVALAL